MLAGSQALSERPVGRGEKFADELLNRLGDGASPNGSLYFR